MQDNCIFCKIVRGEIPCYKVHENAEFMAFLDISPLNKGHVQVIPKKHYRWTWDVPNFGEYWEFAKVVANATMESLQAPMVEFLTHGVEVEHAHIWVVPIYKNEAFIDTSSRKKFETDEMMQITARIQSAVKK